MVYNPITVVVSRPRPQYKNCRTAVAVEGTLLAVNQSKRHVIPQLQFCSFRFYNDFSICQVAKSGSLIIF
jgi:hypothetical protein